jgi:hypothetical protein
MGRITQFRAVDPLFAVKTPATLIVCGVARHCQTPSLTV